MGDDEALVFKVNRSISGEDNFEIVMDDDTCEEVFAEYRRLLEEQQ